MNKILLLFISLFLSTNVFSFEDDETKYLKLKYEWFGQINDSLKIRIRTTSTNFQINWNPLDGGEFENVTLIHKDGLKYIEKEFDSSDDREIWIRGDEYSFWFSNKENKTINKYKNNYFKLVDVLNWGNGKWSNFKETFQYCYYLRTFTADDKPDLSKAITMERAFDNAMVFNADIADWDVSNVNCFNRTFSNTKKFNSDLSKWLFAPKNYGITIDSMFYNARKFDSDISDWNYTHINKVDNLFLGATSIRPVKVLDVLVAITAAHKEKNHIKTLSSLFNFSVDLAIPNYSGLLFYSSWNKKEVDSTNTIPKVIANPSITVLKGEIIQLTDNVLRYFDDEGDSMGGLQFYIPSEGINEIGNDQIWIDLNDNNVADENDLRYNDLKRLNGGDIITVDNTDELRFNFSQKETIRLNYKITDITAYDDESDFSQLTINVVDDLPSIIYFQQELVKCKEKDESYLLPIHVKLSEVSGEDIKFKIKNYGSVSEIESEIAESEYCIPAGKKEISFNVTIKADEIEEDTKSVFFYFDNIINANCGVSNSVMELRIMDDDLKPTVIRKSWAMPSNLHKGNIVGCIDYADDNTKDNVNFRLESDPEGVINIDGYGIIRLITERKLKYSYKINSGGSGGFFSMKPNGFGFVDDNYKFFSFSVIDGVENHETVINSTLVVRPPYTTPALNTKIIIVREDKKEIPKIDTSGFDGFKIKLKEEDSIFYFEDNELKIKEDAELEYRDKKSYKFDYYLSNSVCFSDKVIRSVSSYYSARGIFSNIVINIESINTPPSILNTKLKFKENSSFVGEIEYEDIDDPAANISFSLSGEDKDLFKIDGHELKLVDAEGFDFENDKHVYSVKLKAFDTESYSEEMEISLRLEDADEPAVIKSVSFVVNENESNIVVGTIDYDDPENKELKFDLLNNIDLFDISHNNIIKLKMDVKLDYEKQALYNLNIKSNETDAKEFSIIINVLDVPEAPQIITENINVKDGEFLISEIQAFDPEGDNFVFSVVANDEYSCVGDIIISKSKLHYHSAGSNSYSIKISATETKATNPKSTEKDITIHIVNTLEFSSITSTVFEISETIGDISETYIGDIQYTNPENLASINYNLVSNSEKFEIRDNKLYLKLGEALDYEDTSSYVLKLKSEEIGSSEQEIRINIKDENENPVLHVEEISLFENSQLVYLINYSDPDGDELEFSLDEASKSNFSIHKNLLQSITELNYEERSEYKITITATDKGSLSVSEEYTIKIKDVAEFASITSTVFEISETIGDISETFIGDIQYTNPENLASINYNLVSNSEKFEIRDNKLYLKSGEALDYEDTSSYVLKLKSEEIGSEEQEIRINIKDENEKPVLHVEEISLYENSQLVYLINYSDPDGDELEFSLDDASKSNFSIHKNLLQSITELNYEERSEYKITITATDKGSLSVSQEYTIKIKDVAEFSTITSTVFEISETIGDISETYIGDIQYTNPENLASINYNLVSNSEKFEIRDNKLYLKLGEALDYEDTSSYVLKLKSEEIGSSEQEIRINIKDENEKPVLHVEEISLFENSQLVYLINYSDPDGDELEFSLDDASKSNFSIHKNLLQSITELNYEERSEYKITITATDKGSLSVSEEYTIKIKDVAEFSTITSTEFEVSETLGDISETYIGDIQYTNPENLANINYNLVSNSEKFEIRANKLYLKTGEALDYEDTSLYRLAVMSDEEASLWQYIDILVIAKNQKPSIVPVNFQVDENTIIIGSVKCIDDDKNIKMELIDSEEFFYFEGMTIKVQKDKVLDYEEFKQKTIRVRAFDGDLYSDILDIDIVINNINEPPVIVSDNFVIAGRELNIGKIQAYDPDGDLFRLQIKNSNGLFFIDGDELKVKSNKLYDKIEQHFVVVEAYDGELISEKTIELTVVDFNDPPIVETAIINVFENSDIRREIKYYDSDNDDVVLRLSKTSDLFVIQDNQLRLKNEFNVDFERQKEHYIYVIANDGLLDSNPFKIKIQVLDENDNKPVIKTDNINISCKLENNALIGVLEAEDLDSKTILNEWTILEGNIDAVSLNPESGELRIKDYRYINEMSNLKYMVTVGDGINISDPSQISLSLDKDAYKKQNFESIILYPSFNNGNFNLFSYSYIIDKLIVVSQSGKILMNIPVNSAYKRITTSLPDGSYMVKIYYMDESKNRKVIVKKMIVSKIAYN